MINKFRNIRTEHYEIGKGVLVVGIFLFIGKIIGAAKEIAIAYRYGVSIDVDAYLYVSNLIVWPINLWFSVLTVVLIPLAVNLRQEKPNEIRIFHSELLGLALLIGICLMLVAYFFLPFLVNSTSIGLPLTSRKTAISMIQVLPILIPLGMVGSLMSVWVLSSGLQINSLLECLPSLGLLIITLLFSTEDGFSLIWGTVLGYSLNVLALIYYMYQRREIGWPRISQKSINWDQFWKGFSIIVFGQIFMSMISFIDQFYIANLSSGSISIVNYANRLMGLILTLGSIAISRATLPIFSKSKNESIKEIKDLYNIAIRWTWIFFIICTFSSLIIWIFSNDIVKLLFERGAFTKENSGEVSNLLKYYLIQVPFYCSGIVLVSLLASQKLYTLIAISGIMNLCVKLSINWILVPSMDIYGVALGTSFMYILSFIFLLYTVNYKFNLKKVIL